MTKKNSDQNSKIVPSFVKEMMNSLRTSELLELFLNLGDKPTITEDAVLRADDVALFQLLPLLMAHLQHVGETYGACDRRRADFVRLLHVLRVRMASCRWLKFRFLALAHHPAYAGFWSYVPVHRSHAYVVARHTVNQLVAQVALPRVAAPTDDEKSVHTPGYASVQPEHDDGGDGDDGAPVEAMLADASKLLSFAATSLFHPRCSVRCHTLLYHSVEVRDAFTGANLVDTIVARARVGQRAHAVAVAQKLLDMGVIYAVVARAPTFVDSDRAIYQCRHDILRDADLRFRIMSADGIEISTSDSSRSISSSVDAQRRQQLEQQADGEEKKKNHAIRRVELRLPVDVVDLQSLDFWTAGVFVNDAKKGYHYGFRSVVHPFYSVGLAQGDRNLTVVGNDKELPADASAPACNTLTDTDTDTDADDAVLAAVSTGRNTTSGEAVDSDGPGDVYANVGADSGITMSHPTIRDQGGSDWMQQSAIVSSVVVRKVFSSIAHPMIVELRQPRENGVLTDDEQFVLLPPPVFVKSGDNLMQDLGVQIMFHLFNHMWNTSPLLKPFGKPPFCVTYEVMPTSTSNGLMQAVTGLRSLKDFNWDEWRNTYSVDKDCIFDMVRSAVGSYIGTCIIGYVLFPLLIYTFLLFFSLCIWGLQTESSFRRCCSHY